MRLSDSTTTAQRDHRSSSSKDETPGKLWSMADYEAAEARAEVMGAKLHRWTEEGLVK